MYTAVWFEIINNRLGWVILFNGISPVDGYLKLICLHTVICPSNTNGPIITSMSWMIVPWAVLCNYIFCYCKKQKIRYTRITDPWVQLDSWTERERERGGAKEERKKLPIRTFKKTFPACYVFPACVCAGVPRRWIGPARPGCWTRWPVDLNEIASGSFFLR